MLRRLPSIEKSFAVQGVVRHGRRFSSGDGAIEWRPMRFDVDMALAVCGSLAGSEGRRGVPFPACPVLSCLDVVGRLHHRMHSTRGMAFVKGGWAGLGRVGDTWILRKGRKGFVLLQAGCG
jgi:hypothetical protein